MLIDGRRIERGATLETHVCIVGAGAAGLTLAQAFDGAPFTVTLLESGGFHYDAAAQSLADGTAEADPYPFMESRARRFGGSTTRWSGACIPLDAGDFQAKPWLPHSGWPFERRSLWPYYQQARKIFGLSNGDPPVPEASPFHQAPLEAKIVQLSSPLDLGQKYRQQIVRSQNITLVAFANLTQLLTDADGQQITRLEVQQGPDRSFSITPQTVILATGGIENARLLLASNQQQPRGLGNSHDLVGRFFMEHYYKVVGILPLNHHRQAARLFTDFQPVESTCYQGTFGLTDEHRNQHQLLNTHVRLYRYSQLEDSPAVIAAKQLPGSLLRDRNWTAAASACQKIVHSNWPVLPRYIGWHFWNKLNSSARFEHVRLQTWVEQEPDPANRVMLSPQRDRLGQPQAHLDFGFSQRTWSSVKQSLQHMDRALQAQGLGCLEYEAARCEHLASYDKIGLHHMGTTRMHNSPRHGVVDSNCKVHQLSNLYVAGSSVFPTGGAANPTLTIAALALRLADHIKRLY